MRGFKSVFNILVVVTILVILGFSPIPYVLETTRPALHAKDFISVEGQYENKSGQILLTAVGISKARGFSVLLALLPDYSLISESDYIIPEDYYDTHDKVEEAKSSTIEASLLNALQVAYQAANKPVYVSYDDKIYVKSVYPSSKFANKLQKGDQILKVNGQVFSSTFEIADQIEKGKVGDIVTIEYNHNGVVETASAPLIINNSTGKVDLGAELYSQILYGSNPNVNFKTNGVGGPSGGLMFGLEIYNQLVADDITKGHIIAGTGTIDHNGKVGEIDGVEKKVLAADKAGAEYFFAPDNDIEPEIARLNPKLRTNYHRALSEAIKIKSKMKIVPVRTFNDALNYLRQLQ